MSLAALLIILSIFPGFIFNLAYYNSDSISLNTSLTHKAFASLFITVLLHSAGILILIFLFGKVINFELVLVLLSGVQDTATINSISNSTIINTILYLVCLYIVAYGIGSLSRWGIKKYSLDRYIFFQIDNPWYYLFKGYDWKDGRQPDGVKIAATMEIAGKSYLYVGVLDNFFLNKEGSIDRLVLVSASRRLLQNDKNLVPESERFYPIDGHYFVIKYNEVKNLNIEYFNILQDKTGISIQYVTPTDN